LERCLQGLYLICAVCEEHLRGVVERIEKKLKKQEEKIDKKDIFAKNSDIGSSRGPDSNSII